MQISKSNVTLVLDLDDTLYSEREYLRSGLKFILNSISDWTQQGVTFSVDDLMEYPNPLDVLSEGLGLNPNIKESLLWMYRLHTPKIELNPDALKLINYCKSSSIKLAIITDGRFVTQSLKLKALNLLQIKSYISEFHGEVKPSLSRFIKVESDFRTSRYIYVGDNPKKDFIAPNQLGWTTIGLSYRKDNIHTYNISDLTKAQRPTVWVDDLSEVIQKIQEGTE